MECIKKQEYYYKNEKQNRKKWHKTIQALKRKNRYQCGMVEELWYGDDLPEYRFRILPEIYNIVQVYWEPQMVPFVTEVLYGNCATCHRNKFSNLFKMMLIDNAIEDYRDNQKYFAEKLKLISFLFKNILDSFLINEIDWADVEKAKRVAIKIHKSNRWEDYYKMIIKPIMKKIAAYGAHDELFEFKHWKEAADRLNVTEDLDEEVVQYLIEDAFGYIEASDTFQYNPLWIFGSQHYESILKDIWSWDWKEIERLYNE